MSAFTATIVSTGEILMFEHDTPAQLIESYKILNEYAKALEVIKKQLQAKALDIVGDKGLYEHGDYGLRVSNVQRMTYDKAVLRRCLDEDTLDLMLEPSKTKVDAYLKLHLDDLGELSTEIRNGMIPSGKPYTVVKLERLAR